MPTRRADGIFPACARACRLPQVPGDLRRAQRAQRSRPSRSRPVATERPRRCPRGRLRQLTSAWRSRRNQRRLTQPFLSDRLAPELVQDLLRRGMRRFCSQAAATSDAAALARLSQVPPLCPSCGLASKTSGSSAGAKTRLHNSQLQGNDITLTRVGDREYGLCQFPSQGLSAVALPTIAPSLDQTGEHLINYPFKKT